MQWEKIANDPLILKHYDLLNRTGIFEYIEALRRENSGLEELLLEAYDLFRQESVDELAELLIRFLSDKFIPSTLVFILNEGIMVNRIKILSYKKMKPMESGLEISSLEPFERFFRKHSGTTGFSLLEDEMGDAGTLKDLKQFAPEIAVPVSGRSGLYGLILFGPKILGEEYSPEEIAYIDRLMRFTSVSIQNTIHYEHSVKDSKTGLYNHNFFIHRVNEQMARSRRIKKAFSVIVMDIDRFKFFNDTYGHIAGDQVILRTAETLKKISREGDILSRFGGEEFMLLLPFAGSEEAWEAAERIRRSVENQETLYQGEILKITISLGIATYNPHDLLDEQSLLNRADQALYESKKNGRNRSSFFRPGLLRKAQVMNSP